jgi:hypothetical protein
MKRIVFFLFMALSSLYSKAEYELLFCTDADSLKTCKPPGETFDWKGDKTALELLVMNKDTMHTPKLKFKLFSMQNDKQGELYAELSLNLPRNAIFAVKKLFFYKPGYYKVEVLDEHDQALASGFVTILDRE